LKLASGANRILATKGKKVITVDMAKDKPDAETLSSLIVGPSGNLRAPSAWIGKTLLVGFDAEMYKNALA
jgi:hypothetical protein